MRKLKRFYAGEIKIDKEVIAGDPCYCSADHDDVDNVSIPVKHGCYDVYFDESEYNKIYGSRIFALEIVHKDIAGEKNRKEAWELFGEFPVDSGQACIFDADYLKDECREPSGDYKETWYQDMCKIVLQTCEQRGEHDCGTYRGKGVVSESGYGDGWYPVKIARRGEEIVAVRLEY